MAIYQLEQHAPEIHPSAFIFEEATVIGQVTLREEASVWAHAVLRGDNEQIRVGAGSNIQENAVLHTDHGYPLVVGDHVTVGHQAMLHGCKIGDGSLIGIQAVVLNGAVIGRNCVVGAGAIVTEGKVFPDNSLILGAPAKLVRELGEEDLQRFGGHAEGYARLAERYKSRLVRIG
ncbi:gamma carbonic anhydrase family protein [Stutzerimonas frequens]|uniref:gamma carbonic anhydrase family protein n=1 Tax=Stutzerimonas frequens TaxID=2968969 RepID=UPI000D7E8990|nr:gamma carbonic anhydrase family protein [Stutzerimonas frequens]AWT11872.1 gamma carbonic anhydrase family protein [Stutzerimonas frequens]